MDHTVERRLVYESGYLHRKLELFRIKIILAFQMVDSWLQLASEIIDMRVDVVVRISSCARNVGQPIESVINNTAMFLGIGIDNPSYTREANCDSRAF